MSKVNLCDICDFQGGSQPPKSQWTTLQQDGYIRMLQIRDFTQPGKVKAEYVKMTNTTKCCLKDDILIARYGASLGKILTGLSGAYNVAMTKAVPNEAVISKKFLYYFLCSDTFQNCILNVGVRAAQAGFNKEDLSNIELYCPDLSIQNKICKILELVDVLVNKSKLQLDELDLLVKSRFVEMFGDLNSNEKNWGKESLKHHAKVIVGYPFKSKDYTETGIRIVGGYNLMQGYVVWSECKYWERIDGYEKYLLEADDIVMAMDRPWVNGGFKISKIDGRELPALLIQRTACIRAIDIEQDYLYMLLNSDCFAEHCNIKGSLVPHISNKDIDSFEIFIPPHELQMEFAYFIKQVDKSKFVVTAKFQ